MKVAPATLTTLLAALALGATAQEASSPDSAAEATSGGGSSAGATANFRDLDLNQDNLLDENEAREAGLEREFTTMDSSRDSNVDRDEYEQWNGGETDSADAP